jgi:anti-anti-sigma factor
MSFAIAFKFFEQAALIELSGELDGRSAPRFKEVVELAAARAPKRLILMMKELRYMSSAGLRVLVFAKQKLGPAVELVLVGAQGGVLQTLMLTGIHRSGVLLDQLPDESVWSGQRGLT